MWLKSSGSVTLQAWPPRHQPRAWRRAGPRRAAPSRMPGPACRPRRRSAGSASRISPSRSSMSKARERGDPRLDVRRALEMGELAPPPRRRAGRRSRRSSGPDRGRSAGRGRRRATPLSRSSARRVSKQRAKCGSGLRPAVDHDEPVEPLGRAQRQREADRRRPRHGRPGCARSRPSPSISASMSSAMSSTVTVGGSARSLRPVPR